MYFWEDDGGDFLDADLCLEDKRVTIRNGVDDNIFKDRRNEKFLKSMCEYFVKDDIR